MAGVVTGVGGVFVGLTATRASAHADLAKNGWFVASLVITICGVVALIVILSHWAVSSWRRARRNRQPVRPRGSSGPLLGAFGKQNSRLVPTSGNQSCRSHRVDRLGSHLGARQR